MPGKEFRHGIALFNRAQFFAAHEVLEDVWRAARPSERKFLQGLIQIAVAFHHYSTGNLPGARSLLERGCRNLEGYPAEFCGVELSELLRALQPWRGALDHGTPPPALPRVEVR